MHIPPSLFNKDTVYRTIGSDSLSGHLGAGFINKKDYRDYNIDMVLPVYSGVFVLNGTGRYCDINGNSTPLSPGCFFQRMPSIKHSTYVDEGSNWLEFFICIPPQFFHSMLAMNLPGSQAPVLHPGLNIGLLDTFVQFMENLRKASDSELPYLLCEAQKIIYTLYTLSHQSKTNNAALIDLACTLLRQHATSRLSTEEICQELNIGYEKFRKLFKEHIGLSPTQYMIHHRVNLAKSLLLSSDSSIENLAYELGYIDPQTFSKQFKKFTGLSPIDFKKMY